MLMGALLQQDIRPLPKQSHFVLWERQKPVQNTHILLCTLRSSANFSCPENKTLGFERGLLA